MAGSRAGCELRRKRFPALEPERGYLRCRECHDAADDRTGGVAVSQSFRGTPQRRFKISQMVRRAPQTEGDGILGADLAPSAQLFNGRRQGIRRNGRGLAKTVFGKPLGYMRQHRLQEILAE